MSVDGVADEVVAVMARARSLFAEAESADTVDTDIASAAEASAAIAGRSGEMSGSFADAHRGALDAVSTELRQASGADTRLAEQISDAADTAAAGASSARDLHDAADAVVDSLDPWGDLPVAELAALKALRQHLGGMQQLMADYTAEAQRLADAVGALQYGK